jgi:putative transposase
VKRKQEPNWKTLAGWVRQYKEAGMDFRVLIPRNYRKGRRVRIRGEEEEKVIREFDALYLTMERPVPALLYKNMQVRYHTEKKHNPLAKSWNLMSRSAFYDRLARLDKFEVTRRRYGLQVAKTMFMHGGNGPVAEHPLDVVELDATESDCEVWNDEMTAVIGRPWVYVAIDRCTRMVVGIYIGFEPPSAYSLLQCVKNGVLPKNLRESYPDIPYDWPVMGAWGTAVTDNSKEALSNSLKSVLGILGTDHDLAPILTPQFKGIVERFLKTFNEDGTARIPGKTFGNPVKRGEYISSEAAVLTISQFRYFIHYWLIVDYNYAWHDGIAAVPALLWEERIKGYQPRLPEALGEIDGHFGQLHTATLSKTGLTFKYLEYKSAYLSDLHYKYGNIELSFKVDPIDLSFIYVVDPNNKRLCAVPCDDLTYTNGLTLHQHEQVLKLRRNRKVNWENSEIRLEMRAELIAWTENLLKEAKATKKRAHARTANQGVVQPQSRQSGEEALARLLAKARSKPAGENPFAKHSSVRASGASTSIEPTDEIDISAFKIHKGEHRV